MAQCPHCKKRIDEDNKLIQESKEDYWLCICADYHKGFPYNCPRKKPILTIHPEEPKNKCPKCQKADVSYIMTFPERKSDTIIATCNNCGYKIKHSDWHGKSIFDKVKKDGNKKN